MTAKTNSETRSFLSKVEPVRRQLKAWRKTRKYGERIPESVWIATCELARTFGVSRVSRAVPVSYYALKERVQGAKQPRRNSDNCATFVELPAPTRQSECLVELEDG